MCCCLACPSKCYIVDACVSVADSLHTACWSLCCGVNFVDSHLLLGCLCAHEVASLNNIKVCLKIVFVVQYDSDIVMTVWVVFITNYWRVNHESGIIVSAIILVLCQHSWIPFLDNKGCLPLFYELEYSCLLVSYVDFFWLGLALGLLWQ